MQGAARTVVIEHFVGPQGLHAELGGHGPQSALVWLFAIVEVARTKRKNRRRPVTRVQSAQRRRRRAQEDQIAGVSEIPELDEGQSLFATRVTERQCSAQARIAEA